MRPGLKLAISPGWSRGVIFRSVCTGVVVKAVGRVVVLPRIWVVRWRRPTRVDLRSARLSGDSILQLKGQISVRDGQSPIDHHYCRRPTTRRRHPGLDPALRVASLSCGTSDEPRRKGRAGRVSPAAVLRFRG
jgi:hypothetical protein